MKLNIDYLNFHEALQKFKENKELKPTEKNILLEVLETSIDNYIPTKQDLDLQKKRIEQLDKLDCNKNPETFARIIKECSKFENKYC